MIFFIILPPLIQKLIYIVVCRIKDSFKQKNKQKLFFFWDLFRPQKILVYKNLSLKLLIYVTICAVKLTKFLVNKFFEASFVIGIPPYFFRIIVPLKDFNLLLNFDVLIIDFVIILKHPLLSTIFHKPPPFHLRYSPSLLNQKTGDVNEGGILKYLRDLIIPIGTFTSPLKQYYNLLNSKINIYTKFPHPR